MLCAVASAYRPELFVWPDCVGSFGRIKFQSARFSWSCNINQKNTGFEPALKPERCTLLTHRDFCSIDKLNRKSTEKSFSFLPDEQKSNYLRTQRDCLKNESNLHSDEDQLQITAFHHAAETNVSFLHVSTSSGLQLRQGWCTTNQLWSNLKWPGQNQFFSGHLWSGRLERGRLHFLLL